MEWIHSAIPPCGSFDWTKRKEVPVYPFYSTLRAEWGQYWGGFTICLQILWHLSYGEQRESVPHPTPHPKQCESVPHPYSPPHGIWAKQSDFFITSRWLSWQPLLKSQLTASINYQTQEERHLPVISAPKPARHSQLSSHPQPEGLESPNLRLQISWSKVPWASQNSCFMPLRFGVACYIAVVTRTDLQRPVFFIFQLSW